ncbi:MAG: ABC transporter substrate-binding protein [Proteobacteria bacterium]|nr:ABC transporter substrate-binding protein [Pseudomonadota bacterium]
MATVVTVAWMGPLPPKVVVMSTGTAGGTYDTFAQHYKAILARSGVVLRLVPSAGGVENLARLNDPRSGVMVAFVQSGLTSEAQSPNLESLGTLFYEPFWFFSREANLGTRLEGLRGKKVSVGPEGSGTRALAVQFLASDGIDKNNAQLLPLTAAQAGDALLRGEIDAAIIVASWDTPVVRRLLDTADIHVLQFPHVDAFLALHPFLSRLLLPEGVADMDTDRPPTDITLVAPKASLIVRRDLHPAIQYLLLDAADEIHAAPGIFQKPGQFPAREEEDLPLSKEAIRYFKSGDPFLQRYLPFWLAIVAGRILVLLIPVIGIVFPLVRTAPALYGWSMRRRIFRLYGELRFIEIEFETKGNRVTDDMLSRLNRLEQRADHLRLPRAFATLLYTLRLHIGMVRNRLKESGR